MINHTEINIKRTRPEYSPAVHNLILLATDILAGWLCGLFGYEVDIDRERKR
jgi:hypothetical protein